MIKLPKKIKIGYADYKVINMKSDYADHDSKEGHCQNSHHIITIRVDDRPESEVANTLLHEVLHAIWFMWGNGHAQEEETCVNTLSNGLMTCFRDNPELIEYFSEAVQD